MMLSSQNLIFVGSVMTKFTIALREIGTYKEVLRSQVNSSFESRFYGILLLFIYITSPGGKILVLYPFFERVIYDIIKSDLK